MIARGWMFSATCCGGPWDGQFYSHSGGMSHVGIFNLVGLGGVRGCYTISGDFRRWEWGPWKDRA